MRIIIAASSFKLLFAILVFSPGQILVRHFDISCFASAESSHLQAEYSALIWIGECSTITITMIWIMSRERLTVTVLCS